jgi:hypothetical protein
VAVRKAITKAIGRIEACHPALGAYLTSTIHTGVYCSYRPDERVRWSVLGTSFPSGVTPEGRGD